MKIALDFGVKTGLFNALELCEPGQDPVRALAFL